MLATEALVADLAHADDPVGYRPQGNGGQSGGYDEAFVHRTHDVLGGAQLDEEGTDHRGDDAGAANNQRIQHHLAGQYGIAREEDRGQDHSGHDGHRIGLEQISRHAGAVANIVAHVIGDGGGVAGVILGDAGLDLAHQITADIGALGEDATAKTGEDGDQRCAKAQAHQGINKFTARNTHFQQHRISDRHAQQGQASHQHAGNGAGFEGDLQTFAQALAGTLGSAHIGADRDVHANITRRTRKHRADQEGRRDGNIEKQQQNKKDHHTNCADRNVLPV